MFDSVEKKDKLKKAFLLVWTCVGACILVGVIIYLLNILSLPMSMLIWTLVFVFCLRGIVNTLQKKGLSRVVATALSYVVLFLVVGAVGFLIFSPMFGLNDQFIDILTNIPVYVEQTSKWLSDLYSKYSSWLDNETVHNIINSVGASVSSWASSMASGAASTVVDFGTAVANGLMAIGFALVVAFWILMELPAIGREMKRIISPRHYEDAHFLHITFTRIMGGYIKGTLIQCFIIGLCCGILFAIVGLQNAPALGVITGTLNIIPIVGPWLGGAVAAITAVFVSPLTAIIALVGTIIIQQFVYTFVSPKIMSDSVDIHPALTLIAMMVGSAIGGAMSGLLGSLVGMLFSIPAVAVMKSCFVYYFEKATGRRVVSEDGVFFKGSPSQGQEVDPLFDATAPSKLDKKDQHKALLKRVEKSIEADIEKSTHDKDVAHDEDAARGKDAVPIKTEPIAKASSSSDTAQTQGHSERAHADDEGAHGGS